jgi:hypothetical protein
MDPIDPGAAACRVHRTGGAKQQHRRAIAPRIEDRHRRMHQPDIAVQDRRHRALGHLGPAMRDRHRVLLVQAQQHLRPLVAELVDQAVVQPAIAGAGIERGVGQVQRAQHMCHHIAAPAAVRPRGQWPFDIRRSERRVATRFRVSAHANSFN